MNLTRRRIASAGAAFLLLFVAETRAQVPSIARQPLPLTLGPGDNAGFVVTATGAPPLSYQWYRDGTAVPGATEDLLYLPDVQVSQAGNYSVRVTNSQGAVLSKDARLTVAAYTKEWVDPTFHNPGGTPLLVLPDGRAIVTSNDYFHRLVRIGSDGKVDTTFSFATPEEHLRPDESWSPIAVVRQDDGRLLVTSSVRKQTHGGSLTTAQVVRVSENGTRDQTFRPPAELEPQINPNVLLVQNGQAVIAVGGNLIRLKADGSIDDAFASATKTTASGDIVAIRSAAIDGAGNFWVGGGNLVWRLRSNGSIDETFPAVSFDGTVGELALAENGLCWVGIIQPSTTPDSSTYRLRRLTPSGKLEADTSDVVLTFNTEIRPSLSLQADGRPIITGAFVAVPTDEEGRFAVHDTVIRLMGDGSIDTSFSPLIGFYHKWLMLPDKVHALAGTFTGVVRVNLSTLGSIEPPRILRVSFDRQAIAAGEDVVVRMVAVGAGISSVDGTVPAADGNAYRYTLRDMQSPRLVYVNGAGGYASASVSVAVSPSAPRLVVSPESIVGRIGQMAVFDGVVRGSYPMHLQWLKDGELLTERELKFSSFDQVEFSQRIQSSTETGIYTLRVRNDFGAVSHDASLKIGAASELANLSVRAEAGTGERVIIVGFVAKNRKQLLIQAIGPELANHGVTGILADPKMTLNSEAGYQISNDNGGGSLVAGSDPLYAQLGATPLYVDVTKSAELRTATRGGVNSVIVSGVGGTSGVALAQIFDADDSTNRLVNLSARVFAGTDNASAITGFIIRGDAPKKVLIRCVGSGLLAAGVTKPLLDPSLRLVDQATHLTIATNDDWEQGNDAAALRSLMASVGAFPLAPKSKDSAMVATLPPGAYSAVVAGAEGSTGIVLLEVYEVPEL
jgi:hypothetical protein